MYGAAGVYGFTNILSIVQQNMFPHDVLELMMLQIKYLQTMIDEAIFELEYDILQTMIDEAIFELEYDISIYGKTITDLGKKSLKSTSSGKSYAANDSTGDSDDHNPTEASQSVGTGDSDNHNPIEASQSVDTVVATLSQPVISTPINSPTAAKEKKSNLDL